MVLRYTVKRSSAIAPELLSDVFYLQLVVCGDRLRKFSQGGKKEMDEHA